MCVFKNKREWIIVVITNATSTYADVINSNISVSLKKIIYIYNYIFSFNKIW